MVATVAAFAATILLLWPSPSRSIPAQARRRSHADATTDALTGLGNRRKLFADMERRRIAGSRDELVAIFDLDGFKAYNDTFGHPAGDALLAALGRKLTLAAAGRGEAYRIGGDEFVVTTRVDGEGVLGARRQR